MMSRFFLAGDKERYRTLIGLEEFCILQKSGKTARKCLE